MSRNIKSATKFLQKEIASLKNTVQIETLKESTAHENRINAENRIKHLENQLFELNGEGAYSNL
jgi:hypothetical protein